MADESECCNQMRQRVFERLMEDLEDGNAPGSELQIGEKGERAVWLHTTDGIKAWLDACLRDGVGKADE